MGAEDNTYILPSSLRTYAPKFPLIPITPISFKKPLIILGTILFLILLGLTLYSIFK